MSETRKKNLVTELLETLSGLHVMQAIRVGSEAIKSYFS